VVLLSVTLLLMPGGAGGVSMVGGLYVATDPPEAAVYVNGELRGISPCGLPDVPVGEVEVKAVRQGRAPAVQTVTIRGDETTRVRLTLQRRPGVGSVAVLVDPPGSSVALDRVPVGRSPKVLLNVAAGTHTLVVSRDGYRPRHEKVTVTPGDQLVLRGNLESLSGAGGEAEHPVRSATLGELEWEEVPPLEELSEEAALDPVRQLVRERRYAEALDELDHVAADPDTRRYALRIARERDVIRRIRRIVEGGYAQLREAVGRDYVLSLRGGIRITGKLLNVTDSELTIQGSAGETTIPLRKVAAEQLARLAAQRLEPGGSEEHLTAALLHAAEGEYGQAYERLRSAADQGRDITGALSYVDSEHLWTTAQKKEQLERTRAQRLGRQAAQSLKTGEGPVRILLDLHRGAEPERATVALGREPFEVRRLTRPFSADTTATADVLLIRDPGPAQSVPPYDRQEIQEIMDFIHGGGGLVFFGTARPPDQAHPFAPLLRWCSTLVGPERLKLAEEIPRNYPKEYALAFPGPGRRHPLTAGVRQVIFPLASPTVRVSGRARVLLRASRFVVTDEESRASPAMAAAGTYGDGRFVVFSNVPVMQSSEHRGSPLFANDAEAMVRQGILWAARGGSP
jgi:hypothetical protein